MDYALPDHMPTSDADATLAPLLDIVFLLVFALMMWVHQEQILIQVPVTAPWPAQRQEQPARESLPELTIDVDGQLMLDGRTVTLPQALHHVQARSAAGRAAAAVLVRCSAQLDYQTVFQVREQFLQAGIDFIEQGQIQQSQGTSRATRQQ